MKINLIWDTSVGSAPAGFQAAVQAAATYLASAFTNNVTLNFRVGYGEISNDATDTTSIAVSAGVSEGGPSTGDYVDLASLKSKLISNAASATQVSAYNTLSSSMDPNADGGNIAVWRPEEKVLGITSGGATANDNGWDGSIGIGSGWSSSEWEGVALHELTHAMGRISGYASYGIQDLFRYSGTGTHVYAGGTGTQYFSINNGVSDLAIYANSSDYGDWNGDALTKLDPCDAFYQSGTDGTRLTTTDLTLMSILGYNLTSTNNAPAGNFIITDNTTHITTQVPGSSYSGPVAGLQHEYGYSGSDNINVTPLVANSWIHTGSGNDAINVASVGGINVLDGGTGSNFLVGGTGSASQDTFFVDDRNAPSDIWSSVVNFHSGDAATLFGITSSNAQLQWVDNQGAAGYQGLTLHVSQVGHPTASLTLSGFTTADLSNGRLSTVFGVENDGTPYLYVHANV